MKKLFLRIQGYDSSKLIFERTVEIGQFTEGQVKHLLRAPAAKAGLDYHEIVGAYAKRGKLNRKRPSHHSKEHRIRDLRVWFKSIFRGGCYR